MQQTGLVVLGNEYAAIIPIVDKLVRLSPRDIHIAVTDEDFKRIPEIISVPDKVVFGTKNRIGRDQVGYIKVLPDGSTLYLEEIRTGKGELAAQAMRRYPATMNAESILSALNPNAQGDSMNKLIVEDKPSDSNDLSKASCSCCTPNTTENSDSQ
jgi:hypothetical protein